jgi:WD40 repeat protein
VCVAGDGRLLVVDLERGAVVRHLTGPLGKAEHVAVALTPDDRYALTGHQVPLDEDTWNEAEDAFQALRMWDLDTGQEMPGFFAQESYVGDIAVTPDGRLVLAVVAHFNLIVWDMETRQYLRTLGDGAAAVEALTVTPDSRHAVAGWGSEPSDVRIWDLQTGQEVATEHGHSFPIGDLALSPDGRYLLSGGGDFVVKVWDLAQTLAGQETSQDRDQETRAWLKAMLPGRRSICFATRQGTLKVWDYEENREVLSLGGHEGIVRAVAITSDERYAVSTGDDGRLKVWDLGSEERLHSIPAADAWRRILALTPDDQQALSLEGPATVGVWDLGTGQAVGTLEASGSIFALAVMPSGRRVVASFWDETSESWGLEGWDLETGRILFTVCDAHWDNIDELIPTPDSRHVLSVCRDGTIGLWDIETGEPIYWLDGHEQWARTVAVTQDSRYGISCANDGTLRVWDLETGQEERVLRGHGDWVWEVVLSGDERRAFSVSNDQTLRVWDWQRGDMLAEVTLGGFLEIVMLDRDRNVLAVQERSGTVYCLRYVEP